MLSHVDSLEIHNSIIFRNVDFSINLISPEGLTQIYTRELRNNRESDEKKCF
jgi:hypothetical protein